METSDSEYFESADEDFESDYEEPKSVRQNLGNKISTNEKLETKSSSTQQSEHANIVQNNESASVGSNNTLEVEEISKCDLDKSKETFIRQSEPVNIAKATVDSKQIVAVDKQIISDLKKPVEKVAQHLENMYPVKESHNFDKDIKKSEIKKEPLIEPKEKQDSLWDDDEIDWGSEAAKEESQNTEHSPNSKNEDSGWDDFDADWDSESPAPTQEQTVVKPPKDPKSVPIKENLWEEGWESLEKPKENESSWGTWGGWGVSSLLNTATQGVSSLTNHVSQGFSTVLESGIGIPNPEEMAKMNKLQLEKENTDKELHGTSENSPSTPVGFGLGNLVSGVSQLTKFVESTGTKVITGGLDTLEAIGKKTVEVLQDGDPGLKKKRAFLKLDAGKSNLSQLLREAKERADKENQEIAQKHIQVKRVKNYETLFDDHQGLVHLEALEMLSKLCNIKLDNLNKSLSGEALQDMQETLEQVAELCELQEDEEDDKVSIEHAKETISNAVKEINIPITYDKLFAVCEEADAWLKNINLNFIDDVELHQQAIDTLAQLTALAVEQFHKAAELLLVKEHRRTADEADSLVQITTIVKSLILREAGKFTDKLSTIEDLHKDKISEHITNIFYEAANSGTYIQDAFQLLVPVLQVGAV